MDDRRCGTCFYEQHGMCRKNPPVVVPTAYYSQGGGPTTLSITHLTAWPVVQINEWCGEWVLKPPATTPF